MLKHTNPQHKHTSFYVDVKTSMLKNSESVSNLQFSQTAIHSTLA